MDRNVLRYHLEHNIPTIGTRIQSTWPMVIEVAGATGQYDYIEFSAEYAPYDNYDLENMARAAEVHQMGSMIKVDYQNRFYVAQKAVVSGFQAVLFCDHRTAEAVADTLDKLTPESPEYGGHMGFVNRRWISNRMSMNQEEYLKMASEPVKAFMIEKEEAVRNIDEICSVPGVDMIQFGPNDYCMSLGLDPAENRTMLRDVEARLIETAMKHGVAPRAEMNTVDDMKFYLELGVRHFNIGMQLRVLGNFWSEQGEAANELLRNVGLK
ncbi:MAG: aldolase/citrate lyase family protein [Clostridiales bacterium]|nr:aldolase/citrate lyase family protein [Clostridiales bacterium]